MLHPMKGFDGQLEITTTTFEASEGVRRVLKKLRIKNCYSEDYLGAHSSREGRLLSVLCYGKFDKLTKALDGISGITYKPLGASVVSESGVLSELLNTKKVKGKLHFLVDCPHTGPKWIACSKFKYDKKFNTYTMSQTKPNAPNKNGVTQIDSQWDLV